MPTTTTVSIELFTAAQQVRDLPCRDEPQLYFADTPHEIELAKALCAECPIREQCLQTALEVGEPWGVWGGHLIERGQILPRKRPRGRPRKNPTAA